MMYRACARCGKIHDAGHVCYVGKQYRDTAERALRNTYAWAQKSRDIRERSAYLCAVCLTEGKYTYTGVEVHHIVKLKDDETGLLEDSNLICLCQYHHKLADAGQIDADFLRKLAADRDGE